MYYAYMNVSQITARVEAQETLSRKNAPLEVIKFAKKSFNTNSDEFWHKGHLYDVASYHIVGDSVFVSVLQDNREEAVVSVIKDYFGSADQYVTNSDNHISSKHTNTPNDGKCMCEEIKSPLIRYSRPSLTYTVIIEPSTSLPDKIVDVPPPRA